MNASNDGTGSNNNNNNNNNDNPQPSKKGKGRQKIAMEKIENETNLQVTFSKRRAGVFKKASELSTLCGAESAVVMFSPGNKPHSFGHPSVEAVANRFLQESGGVGVGVGAGAPPRRNVAHNEAAMQQRNQELVGTEAELEREKQRKKELDALGAAPQLDQMDYGQLDQLRESVMGFKREVEAKAQNNIGGSSSAASAAGAGAGGAGAGAGAGVGALSHGVYGPYGGGHGGYTMQYPHMPVGYNNYVDPAAVVQYDAPGPAGSSDAQADDANNNSNMFQGFPPNYPHPGF